MTKWLVIFAAALGVVALIIAATIFLMATETPRTYVEVTAIAAMFFLCSGYGIYRFWKNK